MHLSGALAVDGRLDPKDRLYLMGFFGDLGLRIVADLQDIAALEPLSAYFRTSLEAYEAKQTSRAPGAVRAALGRLVRSATASVKDAVEPADARPSPQPSPEATPAQASRAAYDSGAASLDLGVPLDGAISGGGGGEEAPVEGRRPRLSKSFLDQAVPVSIGGESVRRQAGGGSHHLAEHLGGSPHQASFEAEISSPTRSPRGLRTPQQPEGRSPRRPQVTIAPSAAAVQVAIAAVREQQQQHYQSSQGGSASPRKSRCSSPRALSPSGRTLDSTFGRTSPSTSKQGTFSQAGSRLAVGRDTAWSKVAGDPVPQSSMMYRPSIKSWDDHRPSSPRAVMGTARRNELWGGSDVNTLSSGPTGHPRQVTRDAPQTVMGSASRFAYGSQNRPNWLS